MSHIEETKTQNEEMTKSLEQIAETEAKKSFELNINTLYDIKGHSGLFLLNGTMQRARMAKFSRVTDGKEIQAKFEECRKLGDIIVYLNGVDADNKKRSIKLETVIKKMYELYPIELPVYKDKNQAESLMAIIVPDYADEFKHYHMKKIISWATDIKIVNDMVNKTTSKATTIEEKRLQDLKVTQVVKEIADFDAFKVEFDKLMDGEANEELVHNLYLEYREAAESESTDLNSWFNDFFKENKSGTHNIWLKSQESNIPATDSESK